MVILRCKSNIYTIQKLLLILNVGGPCMGADGILTPTVAVILAALVESGHVSQLKAML